MHTFHVLIFLELRFDDMHRAPLGWLRHLVTQQPQPYPSVLVVQDRSQSQSQTGEALRLAQTYAGEALLKAHAAQRLAVMMPFQRSAAACTVT